MSKVFLPTMERRPGGSAGVTPMGAVPLRGWRASTVNYFQVNGHGGISSRAWASLAGRLSTIVNISEHPGSQPSPREGGSGGGEGEGGHNCSHPSREIRYRNCAGEPRALPLVGR